MKLFRRATRFQLIVGGICVAAMLGGLLYLQFSSVAALNGAYSSLTGDTGTYATATVERLSGHDSFGNQIAEVKFNDGASRGREQSVTLYGSYLSDRNYNAFHVGSDVLLYKETGAGQYSFVDHYRIGGMVTLAIVLLILVVAIGAWRGITALIGLSVSIFIVAVFVLPLVLAGNDAFVVCSLGALIIASVSIVIAHGFNRRTAVALAGTLVSLLLTILVAYLAQYLTMLNGAGSIDEDGGILYTAHHISLASLLYGGVVIASLGVLNDITTGQSAAVDELYAAHKRQTPARLFRGALSIGREHIAALINTLAVAYLAITLPTIVVAALYNHSSLLVILNSETIMEEVVRTLVVSISLLLAVPITTVIAAYTIPGWARRKKRALKRLRRLFANLV